MSDVKQRATSTYSFALCYCLTLLELVTTKPWMQTLHARAVWKFRGLITPSRNFVEVRWRSRFRS